jgi:Leucine-rich repeat (LRR) protein
VKSNCTLVQLQNRLTASTGLEALTRLEVLSLAHNYITHLDGLAPLRSLRGLDLAANDLRGVWRSLDRCQRLQSLNLAANRIASFQVHFVCLLI